MSQPAPMPRPDARHASAVYGRAAQTASPLERVLLLYDGAIRRVEEGRQAIEAGRIEDRFVALSKAGAILLGLQAALDHERGGVIAEQLDRLYTYLDFRLHEANIRNDAGICAEVTSRLRELREAWAAVQHAHQPAPSVAGGKGWSGAV